MTIPMAEFIWPSDQDRADNDELNRVCEYLEEVMDERDAALEREQALAREASYHQQEIDSLLGRLRKTQTERDVYMAHSARVNEVLFKTFSAIEDGDESALPYDEYRDAFNDAPTASLAKRDLIKQSEGLRLAADFIEQKATDYDAEHGSTDPSTGHREYPGDGADYYNEMIELADDLRQRAQELTQCH